MGNQEKKFSKTYDNLVNKIYRFIFLKVDTKEAAEDLSSQVFVKAWNRVREKNGPDMPEIKNLSAYIYQIARAEIANYHRNKSKFQIISTEAVQIIDTEPDIEQDQQKQSDIEKIKLCLGELQEDYQNIVIWRHLDGMSYKQISRIIGKPQGTIRVMAHRALKELKQKMEKL